jgi:hypothetical protein
LFFFFRFLCFFLYFILDKDGCIVAGSKLSGRGGKASSNSVDYCAQYTTTITVFLPRGIEFSGGGSSGGGQIARLSKKGWEAIIYKTLPGLRRSGALCSAKRTDASGGGEGRGRGL